ncbi:unnamed protein product [Clonostachys chloroleuca]|uniref:Cytochrome P450 n=1 Tax=Clonostachys chloroleuca TaxID=1926264 RepID=A0AA35LQT0_9HYPO|nr:unnamed protein product [Clonostachys chloroleuca]
MSDLITGLARPQIVGTIICSVLVAIGSALFHQVLTRTPLPSNAPKQWTKNDWPIVGAWRFYKRRRDMYLEAQRSTKTGNFSFYVGKKLIVGLSGSEGKKTFFDNRELSISQGNADLLTGVPAPESTEFYQLFTKILTTLLKTTNLVGVLDHFKADSRRAFDGLIAAPSARPGHEWGVMNPFDFMQRLIYQLTVRATGAREVAEDPKLLESTLRMISEFEGRASHARIYFPWLPTINYMIQMLNGIKMYMIFDKIIKDRKKTGKTVDDPFQRLMDDGLSVQDTVSFEIAALVAGLINSTIHAAYLPIYWATNSKCKARIKEEVDSVIAEFRKSEDQSPADVLDTLSLDQWETEFKFMDLSLRESIRLGQPGTAFRKNITNKNIPIGNTGEVIPPDAYVAYLVDNTGLSEDIYLDPLTFNPRRFEENVTEEMKQPHSYLGWGSGRHICLGMRLAKLEVTMVNAYLVSQFDFELSDEHGNSRSEPPAPINRNLHQFNRPTEPVYLRYRSRESSGSSVQ